MRPKLQIEESLSPEVERIASNRVGALPAYTSVNEILFWAELSGLKISEKERNVLYTDEFSWVRFQLCNDEVPILYRCLSRNDTLIIVGSPVVLWSSDWTLALPGSVEIELKDPCEPLYERHFFKIPSPSWSWKPNFEEGHIWMTKKEVRESVIPYILELSESFGGKNELVDAIIESTSDIFDE